MISATEFVCMFKGSSTSALFKCSNGQFYVLKLEGLQYRSILLSTKFLACKLARSIGLPSPDVEVVDINQWLIDQSPELLKTQGFSVFDEGMRAAGSRTPSRAIGVLQLGSRYLVPPGEGSIFDAFPEKMLSRVANLNTFAGALAFDLWTNYSGGGRAIFARSSHETQYGVAYLYHGWVPKELHPLGRPINPTRVVQCRNKAAYQDITEWCEFEPFLRNLETIDVGCIAGQIPECWCDSYKQMREVLRELHERQATVLNLLSRCIDANPETFPKWGIKTHGGRTRAIRAYGAGMTNSLALA